MELFEQTMDACMGMELVLGKKIDGVLQDDWLIGNLVSAFVVSLDVVVPDV